MTDAVEALWAQTTEELARRRRLPEATYRLQLHAGFTFRNAAAIVPYLHDLGVTHCYASPFLKARPGSTHGYDIVDHGSLNPEVGTEADYEAWLAALREHGLGLILDMVPNHMGVATNDNGWWNDVLENGPASRYAGYFDISWHASPRPELQDKVLLPVLGEPYGEVLEAGKLRLEWEAGAFAIAYYERRFPVSPDSYGIILGHEVAELEQALPADDPALLEYQSIRTAISHLPGPAETGPEKVAERQREKEVIKRRLATLAAESEPVRAFIERTVARFNGKPGDPHSFDPLDELLNRQCYRLSYWRVAADEINYRRFFDINDLAALSMERPEVFAATHELVLRLLGKGQLDGLRIDHPDGLYDPGQYFRRLQQHYVLACARELFAADPRYQGVEWADAERELSERLDGGLETGSGPARWPLYVVAEKILGTNEPLLEDWAVAGTSGYEFVNQVNGLFVATAHGAAFTHLYQDWVQDTARFPEVVHRKKSLVLEAALSSELHMLAHQLDRLAQQHRRSRDFTFNGLRDALREVIAYFPVYRSYITDDGPHELDRRYVDTAVRRATSRNALMSRSLFRFVRDMLLMQPPEAAAADEQAEQRRFAGKFQQVTAPVMAKGLEDTAFYVYNRLASLNEVGGNPDRFGVTPDDVHRFLQDRQAHWPYGLSPLSTHDTKRGEDVRARINVLSEMPEQWREAVATWSRLNEPHRLRVEDDIVPDPNEEYLLYQTLVGAWPLEPHTADEHATFVRRIQEYMLKALHEAKVHTSWVNPNTDYDNAVSEFVARILDEAASGAFLNDFRTFQRRISHYGLLNSLAQTLLRVTAPGVPDTYQGTELWDFSLVDPDNRRPVDYERRRQLLRGLQDQVKAAGPDRRPLARELIGAKEDGRVKLYVTWQALACCRDRPGLFSAGEYLPAAAAGFGAEHVFGFARRRGDRWALVAVPRLLTGLVPDGGLPLGRDVWQDDRLVLPADFPRQRLRNVLTGVELTPAGDAGAPGLPLAELFADLPVALLVN